MTEKQEKIDAVELMRSIRKDLNRKYSRSPEEFEKDLDAIRSHHRIPSKDEDSQHPGKNPLKT